VAHWLDDDRLAQRQPAGRPPVAAGVRFWRLTRRNILLYKAAAPVAAELWVPVHFLGGVQISW